MARQSQNPQQGSQLGAQLTVELVQGVARSIALTVEVFLHRGFGSGYVGCGFIGVLAIVLFSLCFPDQNARPLVAFAGLYGVLWLFATINVLIRYWRKTGVEHSRYSGRPIVWSLLPQWNEFTIKYLEALAVILVGWVVHHLNKPLGDYLMIASSFVLLRVYGIASEQRSRAVEMNDSVIEQTMVADRFRDMQDRRI